MTTAGWLTVLKDTLDVSVRVVQVGATGAAAWVGIGWFKRFKQQEQYKLDVQVAKELNAAFFEVYALCGSWLAGAINATTCMDRLNEVYPRCVTVRAEVHLHSEVRLSEIADLLLWLARAVLDSHRKGSGASRRPRKLVQPGDRVLVVLPTAYRGVFEQLTGMIQDSLRGEKVSSALPDRLMERLNTLVHGDMGVPQEPVDLVRLAATLTPTTGRPSAASPDVHGPPQPGDIPPAEVDRGDE